MERAMPDAELRDRLGTSLGGGYTLGRELGGGGMSRVFVAVDARLGRQVVVKVLHPDLAAGLSARRFEREIRVAARLQHPHVLPLLSAGTTGDGLVAGREELPYYTMPFVDGESLRERLARDGALSLGDAVRLLRELADALAYAHGLGVVHRDLKPENVLLSGGHAVVADFGVAKALAAATEGATDRSPTAGAAGRTTDLGMAVGTPAYMAPEQALADPAADHRADLYALGVIAYELLAGMHPFGTRAPQALIAAHLTEAPPPLAARRPDVPPALAVLVTQLLAKDPAARPPSADAVLRALDGVRDGVRDGATVAGPATLRRRRLTTLGATAAVLVVLGALGYAGWRWLPARGRGPIPDPAIRAIAVLPFKNTGPSAADDYFSDGLTDELAHALAHLPGLRIAGRTSSYSFKEKPVVAREVGRLLDVGAYVDGTVRRDRDHLRVTAQLVSTAHDSVLWDSVYDSRSDDVFAVQDSLTHAIAAALARTLGGRDVRDGRGAGGAGRDRGAGGSMVDIGRGTTDQEAYELYLKGRYYFSQRNAVNVTRAIGYFQQAIERDPRFARAYAGLALTYGILANFIPDPTDSATGLATRSAERAMALDSLLGDAQLATAASLERRRRYRESLPHYRAAVALDPSNATVYHWYGFALLNLGRTNEGLVELRRATEIDPLALSARTGHGIALLYARRFAEAEVVARQALVIDSTFTFGFYVVGIAQTLGGHADSAVRTLERGVHLHPGDSQLAELLLFAYATAGRWADADRVREALRRRKPSELLDGTEVAFADAVFGDREPLVRLLTNAAGQRRFANGGNTFGCNPLLDPLWSDGRFRAAMRALGVETCTLARPWPLPARPAAGAIR